MTLILSGTDNSVSSPAVQGGTGGTTTGVYYPASNQVAIATGGTQRLLIDSSGNAGLGVTPSAWTYFKPLQAVRSAFAGSSGQTAVGYNWYYDGSYKYYANDYALAYQQNATNGQHTWSTAASGTAGNPITFTQAMTLDASGRLLVGSTTSVTSIGLQLQSQSGVWSAGIHLRGPSTSTGCYLGASTSSTTTDFELWNEQNGYLRFATNNTERARIDSSGNFLVGGTAITINEKLGVYGAQNSSLNIRVRNTDAGSSASAAIALNASGNTWGIECGSSAKNSNALTFQLDYGGTNSEKMRLDSSGNLLVGTTSVIRAGKISVSFADATSRGIVTKTDVTTTSTAILFTNPNGDVGNITTNASSTAYNTSSDYRLKDNIAPMTGALAKVTALKPVTYKWKADGSDGEGFIAHELAEVCPHAVTGEKDAVDEEGNPVYQGIDTSFLIATLTAAIQELKAEFDAYKATHP